MTKTKKRAKLKNHTINGTKDLSMKPCSVIGKILTPLEQSTRLKLESILEEQRQKEAALIKLEIVVTLSLDTGQLIFDNGRHLIEHEPDGPTGQYLLAALRNQKKLFDKQRSERISKHTSISKHDPQIEVQTKLVISNYVNLGSGKGKVRIEEKVSGLKKQPIVTLALSDLLEL
jgi:hypothetical protein